jgi:1,4-dihydroxy-2-naphthoyl-CoA hydrolase
MTVWFAPPSLPLVNRREVAGLAAALGVEFSALGDDWLAATMPVDARSCQPMGLLHGGVSLALAGIVGTAAARLCLDPARRQRCRIAEVNGNHLRGVRSGRVTATARPCHVGARSHVWQVEIRDDRGRLACIARLTLAIGAAA